MLASLISNLEISSPNLPIPLVFDNQNFVLEDAKGFEFPLIRFPKYNLPGQSGAFVSNQLYGERTISIKGTVNAPDNNPITYLSNRATMINTIAIANLTGTLQPLTMTIGLQNGQVLTTQVYLSKELSLPFGVDETDYGEFLLQFSAPDPNLYSQTAIAGTITLPVGGGTAIPTPIPISLAPSSGGQITLNNIGTLVSAPVITITSPITNPYIVNMTSGEFLRINYTINVGDDPIVINCSTQQITQGFENITGIQSSDSMFWQMTPGNNTIGFSSSAGTGVCEIYFFPILLGF